MCKSCGYDNLTVNRIDGEVECAHCGHRDTETPAAEKPVTYSKGYFPFRFGGDWDDDD